MTPIGWLAVDLGPGVRAAFTTRAGGVSSGPWASLNVGDAVGDDPAAVARNRELVADRLGAPIAWARQIHSATVVRPDAGPVGEADALVADRTGAGVGVYTADCAPVLLADARAGVVAAVHAGRAGFTAGVVEAALAAMVGAGADPSRVRAAVGPVICPRCYEVDEASARAAGDRAPAARSVTDRGTAAVDLAAGVTQLLTRGGVVEITKIGGCTSCTTGFFSHRRDGPRTGRQAAVVTSAAHVASRHGGSPG